MPAFLIGLAFIVLLWSMVSAQSVLPAVALFPLAGVLQLLAHYRYGQVGAVVLLLAATVSGLVGIVMKAGRPDALIFFCEVLWLWLLFRTSNVLAESIRSDAHLHLEEVERGEWLIGVLENKVRELEERLGGLKGRLDNYARLERFTDELGGALKVEAAVDLIEKHIGRLLSASRVRIQFFPESVRTQDLDASAFWLLQHRMPLTLSAQGGDPRLSPADRMEGHFLLLAPLMSGERVLGSLKVWRKESAALPETPAGQGGRTGSAVALLPAEREGPPAPPPNSGLRAGRRAGDGRSSPMNRDLQAGAVEDDLRFLSDAANLSSLILGNAQLYEQTEALAARDSLTGLLVRALFDEKIGEEFARARAGRAPLSLMFFDIDLFKSVNDAHGHAAGDTVLKQVAAIISAQTRETDWVCRYGGEEIAVIVPQTGSREVFGTAERIRKEIESRSVSWNGKEIAVTLSGGVAALAAAMREPSDLVRAADEALYRAKGAGRNRIALHDV